MNKIKKTIQRFYIKRTIKKLDMELERIDVENMELFTRDVKINYENQRQHYLGLLEKLKK